MDHPIHPKAGVTLAATLALLAAATVFPAVSPAAPDPAPSPAPSRIVLNPTVRPEISQTVTWRTDAVTVSGQAEIEPAAGGAVRTVVATTKDPVSLAGWTYSSRHHTATFTGLRPETAYRYRVGSEAGWSDWSVFRTAARSLARPWKLLYFGDAQIQLDTLWPQIVDRAFGTVPDAGAAVFAGDMVDRGADDTQWADWFAGLGSHAREINQIPAVGNHEMEGDISLSEYGSHFTNSGNGPAGTDLYHPTFAPAATVSFTDFQGVRIISLDGNDMFPERQLDFLIKALKTNPGRWSVLLIHEPFISNEPNGASPFFKRDLFMPTLRKYNVDLVLQGHNHSYARGSLDSFRRPDGSQGGPVFVEAVSGAKRTPTSAGPPDDWSKNDATRVANMTYTGTFQQIDFGKDRIFFRSYIAFKGIDSDATGEIGDLADSFTIIRNAAGKKTVRDGIVNPKPVAGRFRVLKIRLKDGGRSAVATVRLPGAGRLVMEGQTRPLVARIRPVIRRLKQAATVRVPLRTGPGGRGLRPGVRLRFRVSFTFKPVAGRTQKINRNVTLTGR